MKLEYRENFIPNIKVLISLYKSVRWGHASCPQATFQAVKNSSFVVTVWNGQTLVGLGRAISDQTITVYFPDLLVKPEWQGKGVGSRIMKILLSKYGHLHNQVLIAEDDKARNFYKKLGFLDENFALSITKKFPDE